MKNSRTIYWEYYHPNDEDLKNLKKSAVFTFDACSLLQFYWLGNDDRKSLYKKLEKLKSENRLWIPYQFFKEYLKNRPTTIAQINDSIQPAIQSITEKLVTISEDIKHGQSKDTLRKLLDNFNSKINKKFSSIKIDYSLWINDKNDPIHKKICSIFNDRIGDKPDYKQASLYKNQAIERFEYQLPPGYTDKPKETNNVGDAVAWLQILEKFKFSKKSLVLLTEEKKKDWYEQYIEKGKNAPSRHLCREYHDKCKGLFNVINLSSFISKESLTQNQSEQTTSNKPVLIAGPSTVNLNTNNNVSTSE